MTRLILTFALAGFATTLAVAQTAKEHDHDKMVQGGGKLPAGWQARLDNAGASLEGVKLEAAGGGLHVTSGPAGDFFKTGRKKTRSYANHPTLPQPHAAAPHPAAAPPRR